MLSRGWCVHFLDSGEGETGHACPDTTDTTDMYKSSRLPLPRELCPGLLTVVVREWWMPLSIGDRLCGLVVKLSSSSAGVGVGLREGEGEGSSCYRRAISVAEKLDGDYHALCGRLGVNVVCASRGPHSINGILSVYLILGCLLHVLPCGRPLFRSRPSHIDGFKRTDFDWLPCQTYDLTGWPSGRIPWLGERANLI